MVTEHFELDPAERQARVGGQPVHLTATEWRLLDALVEAEGAVVGSRDLLMRVWGASYTDQRDYVRVYVGALRRKLEPDPGPTALPAHQSGPRLPLRPTSRVEAPSMRPTRPASSLRTTAGERSLVSR